MRIYNSFNNATYSKGFQHEHFKYENMLKWIYKNGNAPILSKLSILDKRNFKKLK
jgi:hypothetical protein